MAVKIEVITPDVAKFYLNTQYRNRKIKTSHITALTKAMREKTFLFNGDPIRFNKVGELIDGQHRLLACIESGEPFQAVIVTELDPSTQDVIDTGVKRSPGDILGLKGYTDANNLAATLRWLWRLDNRYYKAYIVKPQTSDLELTLNRHPGVKDSLTPAKAAGGLMTRSLAGALYTLFSERHSRDTYKFFQLLKTGEGLFKGEAIYTLRMLLINNATRKAKLPDYEIAAVTIKAFNAFIANKSIRSLRWRTEGDSVEEFPIIK